MLNTSLHNPNVKDKPSVQKFTAMNRGINDGGDLPEDLLRVSEVQEVHSALCDITHHVFRLCEFRQNSTSKGPFVGKYECAVEFLVDI